MKSEREHLRGASPGKACELRCRHCQDRVLLVTAERSEALKYFVLHLTKDHDWTEKVGMIVEGRDMLIGPAPYRCDLCSAITEPPWWTYTTDRKLKVEDPGWLVCEPCHALIMLLPEPLVELRERALRINLETFILDSVPVPEIRDQLEGSMRRFLDHRLPNPVRSIAR